VSFTKTHQLKFKNMAKEKVSKKDQVLIKKNIAYMAEAEKAFYANRRKMYQK